MFLKLQHIIFFLENGENVTIHAKHVGHLKINGIEQSFTKKTGNIVHNKVKCKHFSICINRQANTQFHVHTTVANHDNCFIRLIKKPHTVSIKLSFLNEEEKIIEEMFDVEWKGDSETLNDCQDAYVSKLGDLYITIDKNSNVSETFEFSKVDDENFMNLYWRANQTE